MADGAQRDTREIDLAHEEPSAKAEQVPIQPDKLAVTFGNQWLTLRGDVEVKGQLHQTINLAIVCASTLLTTVVTAGVCHAASVPYWWFTLAAAALAGVCTFLVGLRLLAPTPRPHTRSGRRPSRPR
ncbi:hypothetical protein [Solwaraspora sp. WMMD792]|uniref:hypothetical protein n=1 Tax=Solwaraspora sp. WMMD792 TaxID=3016099 RepID=UPI002415D28D|nr:hypothetical protein [Solwaraspora sp. WMMD792]MDG4774112.1 hypothetical protein [Solwaraspora sp. WMMD792]